MNVPRHKVSLDTESPNLTKVVVGRLSIWYSYVTPVAYAIGDKRVVSENVWSNTTGRHLNLIEPDKAKRVPFKTFMDGLDEQLDALKL